MSKDGFTAVEEYAASKKYTDDTVDGMGIQRGKNCIMLPVERVSNGTKITFQWEDDDTQQEQVFIVPDGAQGPQGVTGIQGIQGPAGQDGEDGKDFGFEQIVYTVAELKALVATTSPPEMLGLWLQSDNQHIYAYIRDDSFVPVTEGITEGYAGLKFFKDLGEINLITIQGRDGRDGAQGPQGIQGPAGTPGTNGVSPTVEVVTSLGGHEAHLEIENVGGATTITGDFMPNKTFVGIAISTTQIGTSGIYRDVVIAIADSKVGDMYRNSTNHQVFLRTDKNGVTNTWEYQYNAKGITGYEEYKMFIDPNATYEEYAQYMRGQNFNPKIVWTKPNLFDVSTDLYRVYNYKIDSVQGAGDAWCHEGVFSDTSDVAIGKYSIFDGSFYLTFTTTAAVPALTQKDTNEYILIYNEQTSKAQIYTVPLDASEPTALGSEMTVSKTKDKPADSTLYDMTLRGMGIWVEIWWEGESKDTARECKKESTTSSSDVISIKTDAIGTTMVITRESGIETEVDMYSDKVMPKLRGDRAKRDLIKFDELLSNRWFEYYDSSLNASLIHNGSNNSYMEYKGGKLNSTSYPMPNPNRHKYYGATILIYDTLEQTPGTVVKVIAGVPEISDYNTTFTYDPSKAGQYSIKVVLNGGGTGEVEYLAGHELEFDAEGKCFTAFNVTLYGKTLFTYRLSINGAAMEEVTKFPGDTWENNTYYAGDKIVYKWSGTNDMWEIVLDNWIYTATSDSTPVWMGGYSIGMYLVSGQYHLRIIQDASSAEAYRVLVDSTGVLDPQGNEYVLEGGNTMDICTEIVEGQLLNYSIHEKYTGRTLTCTAVRYGDMLYFVSTSENVDFTTYHTCTTAERLKMMGYMLGSTEITWYDKTIKRELVWNGARCVEKVANESTTFPASPTNNQKHWSSDTKTLYSWYAGASCWVVCDSKEMTSTERIALFAAGTSDTNIGIVHDSTLNKLFTWSGSMWIEFVQGETKTFTVPSTATAYDYSSVTDTWYVWDDTEKAWFVKDITYTDSATRLALHDYLVTYSTAIIKTHDVTSNLKLISNNGLFAEFLQGEADTFPASPTDGQEYSSDSTKAKYVWDDTNKYWALKDGLLMQLFNASHPIGKIEFGAMPTLGTWAPYDFGGVIYSDNALSDGQVMQARLPNATGVVSIGPDRDWTQSGGGGRAERILGNRGAFYKGTVAERVTPETLRDIVAEYRADTTTDSVIKFDASTSQYYDTTTNVWTDVAGRDVYTNEETTNGYSVAVKGKNTRAWIRTA